MSAATSTHRRHGPAALPDGAGEPLAEPRDHGELTVEIVRGPGSTVVVATGCLGREGGQLLAALLAHAQHRDGRDVTVDLRKVSYADPLGVAEVLDDRLNIGGMSAAVGRALGALVP
jgi:hypothetical protein